MLLAVARGVADPPRPRLAGLRPSSRISARTSSGPATTPQADEVRLTRRYPYVSSESSNAFFTYSSRFLSLFTVADSGAFRHS